MPLDFHFINAEQLRNDPRLGSIYGTLGRQPSWTWRFAAAAAAIVFIVPLLLLGLAAVLAFVVVFTVLSIAARIGSAFSSLFGSTPRAVQPYDPSPTDDPEGAGGDGGRVNVRVIRYD